MHRLFSALFKMINNVILFAQAAVRVTASAQHSQLVHILNLLDPAFAAASSTATAG